ncbi:DUF6615 family protein [Hirschia litorea]|uniref:DUF6615 family protein n=1 Tax=Hirschia litorea TaxID=1199156 RepID=A0ABW2IKQ9_9PROT
MMQSPSLVLTLVELAHATSQNLGFSQEKNVHVSYGEETITETNLLELRRRHPDLIKLETFSKKDEAINGADWEWHIIGSHYVFRMRVQAKRLQKDNKLKIKHKVKSTGKEQIDLLIADAKKYNLKPVYCLYSSEKQRDYWKKKSFEDGETMEVGCLLASARDVKKIMPTKLSAIEKKCIPWHYLAKRRVYIPLKLPGTMVWDGGTVFYAGEWWGFEPTETKAQPKGVANFPTFEDLNSKKRIEGEGLSQISPQEYEQFLLSYSSQDKSESDTYLERGIIGKVTIDVSRGGGAQR